MNTVHTLHASPLQTIRKTVGWLLRFGILLVLYFILFAAGGGLVAPYLPNTAAEPGPLPMMTSLVIVCAATVLVIMLMIYSSRWHGWKSIVAIALAYYLVVTLVMQLETWYFLHGITVSTELLLRLFLQGLPVAFLFVPLAVVIMGRVHPLKGVQESPEIVPMTLKESVWKLGVIYIAYLALYYSAGYFIAWQNEEVRAFYGSPGEALPFLQHMANVFANDPWLTPFQLLRTLIWVVGALPVIRGSRLPLWQTALVVGLMLSVPQNIGHILSNPLIPFNSVRISHLIETASSTFIFGLIMTRLLYPKYIHQKS